MLRLFPEFTRSCGYYVTDLGATEPARAESCTCDLIFIVDGCNVCFECGTVWGVVVGYHKPPKRAYWRRHRNGD